MNSNKSKTKSRFSLLYLEDQEISTHSFEATLEMTDSITHKHIKENGVFYINSKSFIFDPFDPQIPLYKFLFSHFNINKNYNDSSDTSDLLKCPKKLKFHKEAILQFKIKRILEIKVSLLLRFGLFKNYKQRFTPSLKNPNYT
jgi:hypothetical protein